MKFSVQSKALTSHLAAVGKAVNQKSPIAILSHFLFVLDGKTLSVTGADMENVITARIAVDDADGNGRFCVNAKRITDFLKMIPDSTVNFSVNEENLKIQISYTNGEYSMMAVSADEYTATAERQPDGAESASSEFTLPSHVILGAIENVGFACGADDLRAQLQGIYWDVKGDSVTFVATDTHILSKYRNTKVAPGVETSFILPTRAVNIVKGLIGKEAMIKVTHTENGVFFKGETFDIRCSQHKGRFPNYNAVIPKEHNTCVTIDRQSLLNAVNRIGICASSSFSLVKLRFTSSAVNVSASDIDFAIDGNETVGCACQGNDMTIGFSGEYLKGILGTLSTSNIVIKMTDATRPGVFVPSENDEYGELTLLAMPVSISD